MFAPCLPRQEKRGQHLQTAGRGPYASRIKHRDVAIGAPEAKDAYELCLQLQTEETWLVATSATIQGPPSETTLQPQMAA